MKGTSSERIWVCIVLSIRVPENGGSEWRPWGGEIEPGFFHSDSVAAAREHLHAQGHVRRVSVTHKRELRKLMVQLGTGRLVIAREPAHAEEIAEFCAHFGLE